MKMIMNSGMAEEVYNRNNANPNHRTVMEEVRGILNLNGKLAVNFLSVVDTFIPSCSNAS